MYFVAIEQNERNLFILEKNNNQKSMEKNIFLPLRVSSAHETYLLQRTSLFLRLITRFSNFSKVKANVKNRDIVEQMARDRFVRKMYRNQLE